MKKNNDISRRDFSTNLAKLLVFGGLTNFGLSAHAVGEHTGKDCPGGRLKEDDCRPVRNARHIIVGESDYCPGGGPIEDLCVPNERLKDFCPGEKMPEDECSASGGQKYEFPNMGTDDYCDTGLVDRDICDNSIAGSDQCASMKPEDDLCEPTQGAVFDRCYSGLQSDDACAPDGGNKTDECPGGGDERDNCKSSDRAFTWTKGAGDECSVENGTPFTADSCKPVVDEDTCGDWGAADVCYEGTNQTTSRTGGKDICRGLVIAGVFKPYGDGSDTCLDGSNAQDDCGGWNHNHGGKEDDVCLPTSSGEKDDLCDNTMIYDGGTPVGSDDYCYGGQPTSDECKPSLNDVDECPEGSPAVDECVPGSQDPDDCPGGGRAVDECKTGRPDEDECPGGANDVDVCLPNISGSDECESGGVAGEDSGGEGDNGCIDRNPDAAE